MSVTQDLWLSWSVGEQQGFLDEIEAKIKLYQRYHDDVDRWLRLSPDAAPGEAVYPVPLPLLQELSCPPPPNASPLTKICAKCPTIWSRRSSMVN